MVALTQKLNLMALVFREGRGCLGYFSVAPYQNFHLIQGVI